MCPNIDTEEGITALLVSFDADLLTKENNLPIKKIFLALRLLIRNNVLRFGHTFHRHKKGTSIGGPPASDWATKMFECYEMAIIKGVFED